MPRKKVPLTTIGSAVPGAALSPASMPATTSVQPSAIERAGDALGRLIFKSAPVVASGAAALFREFGEREDGQAWRNKSHPKYLQWHKYRNER